MDINNKNLVNLTSKQYLFVNSNSNDFIITEQEMDKLTEAQNDSAVLNGEEVSLFGNVTDDKVIEFNNSLQAVSAPSLDYVTIKKEVSAITQQNIKEKIYKYRHPEVKVTSTDATKTYGANFDEIMKSLGVAPNKSITKAQLTQLAKKDSMEDVNNDLLGAINFAFSDKKPNDKISYRELQRFFMSGAGKDATMDMNEYINVVNRYAQKVQAQYANCTTNQQKLEFILKKTEEYLEASGDSTKFQLEALKRLTSEEAESKATITHDVHKGQISFCDLSRYNHDGFTTMGAYTNMQYPHLTSSNQGGYEGYSTAAWADDYDGTIIDGEAFDGGINLSILYLTDPRFVNWYQLVEVMVHELTHATAFKYYQSVDSQGKVRPTKEGLDYMQSLGILREGEYERFLNNFDDLSENDLNRLEYLLQAIWGEYIAYRDSCDYLDSIARDVFSPNYDMAVKATTNDGQNNGEIEKIKDHVVNGYGNQEPLPDWSWSSYA